METERKQSAVSDKPESPQDDSLVAATGREAGSAVVGTIVGLALGGPVGAIAGAAVAPVISTTVKIVQRALHERHERAKRVMEQSLNEANLSPEQVLALMGDSTEKTESVLRLLEQASKSDPSLEQVLQSILSSTFLSETEIQRERLLIIADAIDGMRVIHMRILEALGTHDGILSAGEIARAVNIPEVELRSVVRDLELRGMIKDNQTHPIEWRLRTLGKAVLELSKQKTIQPKQMKHYLNNAGAGLMSSATLNTVQTHLKLETQEGAYLAARNRRSDMEELYTAAASIIGAADASEIAFVDSASRAWNMAIHGVSLNPGDRIVTLSSEFGTNLVSLFHLAAKVGAQVIVIPCDIEGNFDMERFSNELKAGARLIALSHAVAHGSIVNPVEEIGRLAKNCGALYIVDGCQAVGQFAIDVKAIQCDAYTATGRKWLCGPRGTGFLYIRKGSAFKTDQVDLSAADLKMSPEGTVLGVTTRSDARQFELWERSVASALGLARALKEYLELDKTNASSRRCTSAKRLRDAVLNNPHLQLIGKDYSPSSIVGFYFKEPTLEESAKALFASSGILYSEMHDWDCPLHYPKNGATCIFRLSPHHYTDESTVTTTCDIISRL